MKSFIVEKILLLSYCSFPLTKRNFQQTYSSECLLIYNNKYVVYNYVVYNYVVYNYMVYNYVVYIYVIYNYMVPHVFEVLLLVILFTIETYGMSCDDRPLTCKLTWNSMKTDGNKSYLRYEGQLLSQLTSQTTRNIAFVNIECLFVLFLFSFRCIEL